MEPTSEHELKQLLDEDRISKAEYDQLLAAMLPTKQHIEDKSSSAGSPKKHKFMAILSMIALLCFLVGLVIAVFDKKLILGVVNAIAAILMGASALRYWIRYLSYE